MAGSSVPALGGDVQRAVGAGALEQRAVEIDADDGAAGGPQQHARELADEAEADDGHALAEVHFRLADAVHGDRADGGEGAVLEAHGVGEADAEAAGNVIDLGVHGVAATAAGDAVAWREVADERAGLEDDAGGRVAERGRLVQPRAHRGEGLLHAVAACLLEDERDLVRARARLLDEVLAAGLDLGALGPGAEQARAHVDEHALGRDLGDGDVENLDVARREGVG